MSDDSARYVCPNCCGVMDGLKCKIRCPRCGYFESCSDLEPAMPLSREARAIAGGSRTTKRAESG